MAPRIAALIGALAVMGAAGIASAQTSIYGLNLEGDIELGGRVYVDKPSDEERAKLEEYRDLDEQPFGAFRFRLAPPDESYSVWTSGLNVGQEDQEFTLGVARPGMFTGEFEWNQIPHVYSTTGRLLATRPADNIFVLPTPRPPLEAYNAAPRLDEISQRWDVGRFSFTLTPTPDIDILLEYTRIKKDGEQPRGFGFGSPGSNFYEVLEPIDQTIHDFRAKGSWVGEGWQAQAYYALSIFDNEFTFFRADNPCFGVSACGGDASGPATGQSAEAPSNMAHTFGVAGAVNLPMRTRVAGNASYSLRFQDEDFLPHTINPTINSPLLALPKQSLDGMVGIFLFNVNATTRPLSPLTITARYRLYDFDDMTDAIVFPGHVVSDRSLVTEPRSADRFEYTKHNADLDARWRFNPRYAGTAGFGWERWDRNDHREVQESDEYFARLKLDATPLDWLLARLTYTPSFRRIGDYDTFAHIGHTVVEGLDPDAQAQSQSVLLRKFDEADRDRQRIDLFLQVTPIENLSVTPIASYWFDDYYNSTLGLQEAESYSAGVDVGWTPLPWLWVGVGYVYDRIDYQQRSRSREVVGTDTLDFPDFDWVSNNVDTFHTAHAGLRATLIPNVLDWLVDLSNSFGRSQIKTRNPITPTSGSSSQNANATAKPFPDLDNELFRVGTAFRYRFLKNWYARLGYFFEMFNEVNFRTDTLAPFNPGVTSIYLGNDLRDYTAHIVTMAIGYTFR
jgi:MtrB/PioB family decaheme-associated outer membrane protein